MCSRPWAQLLQLYLHRIRVGLRLVGVYLWPPPHDLAHDGSTAFAIAIIADAICEGGVSAALLGPRHVGFRLPLAEPPISDWQGCKWHATVLDSDRNNHGLP